MPSSPSFSTEVLERPDGVTLTYDRLPGRGLPTLFLPGLTSVRQGEKSTALFADRTRRGLAAARIDLRGHGDSDGAIGETSLSMHVEDVAALIERLGRVHLLGSSFGGLVAAWTAAKFPDRIESLTLLAPAFGFLPRITSHRDDEGHAFWPHESGTIRFETSVLDDFEAHDERTCARSMRSRTLVFHGADDDVVPVGESQRFASELPEDLRRSLWILDRGDHRLADPFPEILALSDAFHGVGTEAAR